MCNISIDNGYIKWFADVGLTLTRNYNLSKSVKWNILLFYLFFI